MNNNLFYRSFELDRAAVDKDKRSVEISFSSETPARRWYGTEILLHDAKNVDLKRLRSMGSVLFNHNPDRIVGPFKNARIEDKRGKGAIVFDDDEEGDRAMGKVLSGSLRGVSVGYMIDKAREVKQDEEYEGIKGPALIAVKWTPFEVSLTPVPLDATVGVGRAATRSLDGIDIITSYNKEDNIMDEEQIRQLVTDMLQKFSSGLQIPSAEEIAGQVRDMVAEEGRPKFRISAEDFADLIGRGGAISQEAKLKVADMTAEGRNVDEIKNELLRMAGNAGDAGDPGGGPGGNGTGTDDTKTQTGLIVKSFKQVEDDSFFSGLKNPTMFPIQ